MTQNFSKISKRMFSNTVTNTITSLRTNQPQLFIRLRNPEPIAESGQTVSQSTEILVSPANVQNLVSENREILVEQRHFLQEPINSQIENSRAAELFVENIYYNLNNPVNILTNNLGSYNINAEVNSFVSAFSHGMHNMHSIASSEPVRIEEFRARLTEVHNVHYDFSNLLANAPQQTHLQGIDIFSHFFSFFGLEALQAIEATIQSNPSLTYPIFLYTFARLFAHFGSSQFFRINSQTRLNAFIMEQINFAIIRLRNALNITISSRELRSIIDQSVISLNNDYTEIISRVHTSRYRARLYSVILTVLPLLYTHSNSVSRAFQAFREIFFAVPNPFTPRITPEASPQTVGQLIDVIIRFISSRARNFLN